MTTSMNTKQGANASRTAGSGRQAWIAGGVITGATLLFLNGVFHFFTGIAGFARQNYFNAAVNYPYDLGSRGWGWIHVILGVILAATGVALFTGSRAARGVALVFLVLSAVANFFFVPFQPFWALLMLALDIFAIWAISSARGRGALGGDEHEHEGTAAMGGRQQAAMTGSGQQMGGYQPAGTGAYQSGSAYQQGEQRWPQNAQGRTNEARQYATDNVKAPDSPGGRSADALRDQAREQAGQGAGQRETAEQAADRARQASRGNNNQGR